MLYREFISKDDVEKTEKVLNEIIYLDELLALTAVNPEQISDAFLTYKNLILTLWARNYLGLSEKPAALTLDEFKRFFDYLCCGKVNRGKPAGRPRHYGRALWR